MVACDAHDAVWGTSKQLSSGEGYLLAARFMQSSAVQEKNIEVGVRMGFPRELYKQQIESIQGKSPWLICEQCADLLKLSEADKGAARQAALSWRRDKTTAGHMPQESLEGGQKAIGGKTSFLSKFFGRKRDEEQGEHSKAASLRHETTLFAFFARATGGPTVVSTSGPEAWVKRLQDEFELPEAPVTIFQEDQWDAPSLDSVDDKAIRKNFATIRRAIHKALIAHGVPAAVLDEITSDVVKLSSPLTGLVIFVVKYTC